MQIMDRIPLPLCMEFLFLLDISHDSWLLCLARANGSPRQAVVALGQSPTVTVTAPAPSALGAVT